MVDGISFSENKMANLFTVLKKYIMIIAIIESSYEQALRETIKIAAASIQSISVPMGQAGITFSHAVTSMNHFKESCQSNFRFKSPLEDEKKPKIFFDKPKSKYHK
jgi:hypothetical protein